MVRQILGAVSQFEKTSLVQKLRQAREEKRLTTGRCEGRPPVPAEAKALAKRLYRKNPKTGKRPSLRAISHALTERGFQKTCSATPMAPIASSAWWAQTGRLTAPYVMDVIISLDYQILTSY